MTFPVALRDLMLLARLAAPEHDQRLDRGRLGLRRCRLRTILGQNALRRGGEQELRGQARD